MSSYLYVLPPHLIPELRSVKGNLHPTVLNALTEHVNSAKWGNNEAAAKSLSALLAAVSIRSWQDGHQTSGSESSRDDSAHDEYFWIRRLDTPAPDVLVWSLLRANQILFQDCWASSFTITLDKLNLLDRAFQTLLARVAGVDSTSTPRISNWTSSGSSVQSMERWIGGHQLFAVLTQGLVAAFHELKNALPQMDAQCVSESVDLAELLLQASAVCLEFTGDFPPHDYNEVIRPSMTFPLVPETFSGLLSVDHRFLIHSLRDMKPLLDGLAADAPDHHQRIAAAITSVYDSHRFVCDRLVGKSPSLMMASGSKKSGAEQIEKFKHLRLKVFEPGTRPAATESALHGSAQRH